MYEVRSSSYNCSGLKKMLKNLNPLDQRALDDCLKLFEDTNVELKATIDDLSKSTIGSKRHHDLQTMLSGAMTNLYTCLDGFAYSKGRVRDRIEKKLLEISHHVSNSLAMLNKVPGVKKLTTSESVVFPEYGNMKKGFPSWVSSKDRKLLQAKVKETKFDLLVAKDGTGNFTTIGEALAVAPNSSTTRFVIHIKEGAYFENVEVIRKKTNLMFVGDGIGKTVVKGSRNVVDGWTTFQSATVAVVGAGFIAKGITFENSAGPDKHQAVALRSGADFSAFYQCSFVGYQDTLYVHSLRQFYRECDIYGTVDFIFGNAAVVFQNCNLYARKPNENQKNLFTAQGREDPNQNTGISILNCKIAAAADLIPVKSSFKSYLGRPWKMYSRTVVLKSFVEDLIDPAGWLEWNETFALDTLYYGEYMNRGPGANTNGRVTWPGYRVINSSTEATQFTVGQFIQGNDWLNSTGIPFFSGLV
ncbi:Putative pectinesterase/pectinesterase inhibitor 40 [Glycine soja]|nr:Putative pectinesterase/pectinesterase inhibitor 40 [Glycine soja]